MSNGRLKVAVFSVRATVQQSARWKKAAELYGFPSHAAHRVAGQLSAIAADVEQELGAWRGEQ